VALATAVEDPRVKAVAGIAPFVQPEDLLNRYDRPKLLVCGAQDEFVDSRPWKSSFKDARAQELALYPGVDHFWMERRGRWGRGLGSFLGSTKKITVSKVRVSSSRPLLVSRSKVFLEIPFPQR